MYNIDILLETFPELAECDIEEVSEEVYTYFFPDMVEEQFRLNDALKGMRYA